MQYALVLGSYYWDTTNKLLLCKDILVASGDEAMAFAITLGAWAEWTRVRARTPMSNRSFKIEEEPVLGMGHSSHRHYDRWGNSLHAHPTDRDRELYEIGE